jgi:hypothetical protein
VKASHTPALDLELDRVVQIADNEYAPGCVAAKEEE